MKVIFLTTLVLLSIISNAQQPGTLDKSFGTGGKVLTSFGKNTTPEILKALVQSDDKIIDVGHYYSASVDSASGLLAVRYTADGILDADYGIGGKAVVEIPFENQTFVNGAAIQKDDKVIISCNSYHEGRNVFIYEGIIIRLKTDGTLDSSFGKNGLIVTNINGTGGYGFVSLQPDGKLILNGSMGGEREPVKYITRLLPDGKVDETFGEKGYAYPNSGYSFAVCKIQTDAKIVLGGYYIQASFKKFCLQRYLPDGTIDKAFGEDGTVITPYGDDSYIHDLGFQSDGKIVVTGQTSIYSLSNTFFATARYNQDGSLDNTFGMDGKVTTMFGDSLCIAQSLAILNDDKIVVGGYKTVDLDTASEFALIRYMPDGVPDSGFGGYGKVTTNFGYASSLASIVLQSSEDCSRRRCRHTAGFSVCACPLQQRHQQAADDCH